MLKFIKSNWFTTCTGVVFIIVCIWLIKIDYFNYSIDLNKLLPPETKLSINLNMSELNTTINQKSKLIKNPIIEKIINNIILDLKPVSKNYEIVWINNIISSLEPEIIYYTTNKNEWGVLAKANNKKLLSNLQSSQSLIISSTFNNLNIYKLTTKNNYTIFFSFINNSILSISSSLDLVKTSQSNYVTNPDSSWQQRFSIINLEPILKIKIDPTIDIEKTKNNTLAQFYQILEPIIKDSETELKLEFNQTGNYLTWQISNIKASNFEAEYNKNNIADNLAYINFKPSLIVGLHKPNVLTESHIIANPAWQALTNFTLSSINIDILKQLTTKIKGSLIISIKDKSDFLIIINNKDFDVGKQLIYEILSKQNPKSIKKTLPDGSVSYELVADGSQIKEKTTIIKNKQIITIFSPNSNTTFNYYIDGEKIIISTNYSLIEENIKNIITTPNQCLINNNFAELFHLNLDIDNKYINLQNLQEFTIFDQSYDKNIVIKGCLKLK